MGKNIRNLFGQTNPRLRMQSRTLLMMLQSRIKDLGSRIKDLMMLLNPGKSPAAAIPPRLKSRVGRERK